MYGKWFASAYTGSMMGAGSTVFAVFAWAVANAGREGVLEINPQLLATMIGCPEDAINIALEYLMQPDPRSRSQIEGGRRLIHEGAFQYRVVNHKRYRELRDEETRREQNRDAKRRQRERDSGLTNDDTADGQRSQPMQKQKQKQRSEAEAEAENAREAPTTTAPDVGETGTVDPLVKTILTILASDQQLRGLGLATLPYAERLFGSVIAAPYPLTDKSAGEALRDAIADLPGNCTEAYARKILRSYLKQVTKRPPGERAHQATADDEAKLHAAANRRRKQDAEDRRQAAEPAPLKPTEISNLAKLAQGALTNNK